MIVRLITLLVLFTFVINKKIDSNSNHHNVNYDSNDYILVCQPIKKVNLNLINLPINESLKNVLKNQNVVFRPPIEPLPNSAMSLVLIDPTKEKSVKNLNNKEAVDLSKQLNGFNKSLINFKEKSIADLPAFNSDEFDKSDFEIINQQKNLNENFNQFKDLTNGLINQREVNSTKTNDQLNNQTNEFSKDNGENKQLRGVNGGTGSNLLSSIAGQFPSLTNQLPTKLTNLINGVNGENSRPDSKLSLIEDDKMLSNLFKQQSNMINQNLQELLPESYKKPTDQLPLVINNSTNSDEKSSNYDQKQTIVSNNQTLSNLPTSSTTSTTVPLNFSSSLSPELIEQNKIFEEYFPPEQRNTPYIRVMLDSMKEKLGLHKQVIPQNKLHAELANLKSSLISPTPLPVSHSSSVPPSPISNSSTLNSNSKYISYDEYKNKQAEKKAKMQAKINNKYLQNEQYYEIKKPAGNHSIENPTDNGNYSYDDKKEHDKHQKEQAEKEAKIQDKTKNTYLENEPVDKLKGNVNGPVEVAALDDVKLPSKNKLDYVENDKPEFRTDSLRLGHISPFNRIPALSRYSKVVSSVSKGLSSLRPVNDRYTSKQNVFPIYGFYRS